MCWARESDLDIFLGALLRLLFLFRLTFLNFFLRLLLTLLTLFGLPALVILLNLLIIPHKALDDFWQTLLKQRIVFQDPLRQTDLLLYFARGSLVPVFLEEKHNQVQHFLQKW